MIYTDGNHICADTRTELRQFARNAGMHSSWYRDFIDHGYFEIFGNMRKLIMRAEGVKLLNAGEFSDKAKQMYVNSEKTAGSAQEMNETTKISKSQKQQNKVIKYKNSHAKVKREVGTAGSRRANKIMQQIMKDESK